MPTYNGYPYDWSTPTVTADSSSVTPTTTPRTRDARGRFASTFSVGDTVRLSQTPGCTGYHGSRVALDRTYHGAVATVVEERHQSLPPVVRVQVLDSWASGESAQWVDRTDLTRTTLPTTIEVGDLVRVSRDPSSREDGSGFVDAVFAGSLCRVVSDAEFGLRQLEYQSGLRNYVHPNFLTVARRGDELYERGVSDPEAARCANPYCREDLNEDNPTVQSTYGREGCDRCTRGCDDCESIHLTTNYSLTQCEGQMLCSDCYYECDDCGAYYSANGDGCPNWDDHERPRGVYNYGHTQATMFLGGPVPKKEDGRQDGYYVGIELEVSASYNQSAMWVYDWAEEHLGNREAMVCKEDASVEGFEIVTQPMTPEFFESVNWESFMDLLDINHPIHGDEPREHGLHVHIGRIAFNRDDVATAAYCYLLSQGDHLERIGQREAYHYCAKVRHPVLAHISTMSRRGKQTPQTRKAEWRGIYAGRDAVNLQNENTIEVRAFKATRSADRLRDAVRLTYLAADYVRYLRVNKEAVSPKSLHWAAFSRWVGNLHPEAFASIAGIETKDTNRKALVGVGGPKVTNYLM